MIARRVHGTERYSGGVAVVKWEGEYRHSPLRPPGIGGLRTQKVLLLSNRVSAFCSFLHDSMIYDSPIYLSLPFKLPFGKNSLIFCLL